MAIRMPCIRTALIPVAGKGTRLRPLTSVIPKALLPLVDSYGNILTVLHVIIKQVMLTGIERVGVIVSDGQQEILERYFAAVDDPTMGNLSHVIEYITQPTSQGFGDAVLRGRDFVGKEPFALLLGDHIYIHNGDNPSCVAQVITEFNNSKCVAMIGVQPVRAEELSKVGVCRGTPLSKNTYKCIQYVEKPNLSVAQNRLVTEGLPADTFLAHCGIYAFAPNIFDCLQNVASTLLPSHPELELAQAQMLLLERHPDQYLLCRISGIACDIGTPEGYASTQVAYRKANCY